MYQLKNLHIVLTYKCNLSCKHCYLNCSPNRSEKIDYTLLASAIENLYETNPLRKISITGGEPLIYPDFLNLVRYCSNFDVELILATNATLMNKDIANGLKDLVDKVYISLDGCCSKTHDKFRNKRGAFNKTVRGLINLRNAGIQTNLTCTISKENINEVPKILEIAYDLAARGIEFRGISSIGRGINCSKINSQELENLLETVSNETSAKSDIYNMKTKKERFDSYPPCVAGFMKASIMPDGAMVPCSAFVNMTKIDNMDYIQKREPSEIWNKPKSKIWNMLRTFPKDIDAKGCRAEALSRGSIYLDLPEANL